MNQVITQEYDAISREKSKIPEDIQKDIIEFFMRTSIPRKKAKNAIIENHLLKKD